MSTTIQTIQSIGDDRRRDSSSGAIDASKKLRAVNDTLQQIHSHGHWEFTTRRKMFNFYGGAESESDYNIPDVLGIADFKDVKDLRLETGHTERFSKVDPNTFDVLNGKGSGANLYAVEYRLGDPILRINYTSGAASTLVGDTSDHDANGTWTADTSTSDASNVGTDTQEYQEGGGSISYDITVGQSVNNQADIYVNTSTQYDLTDYLDFGASFIWWYIPALDAVTGATLRWGSSSSAYYTQSVTTTSQNGALEAGWNKLKFDWVGATVVGSPSVSAIDYLLFRTSYGAGQSSDTDFRINDLKFYIPTGFELLYYSSYVAANSSGTWIAEATSTSDTILIPDRYREVVVSGYCANLLYQMGKFEEAGQYKAEYKRNLAAMAREFSTSPSSAQRTMRPNIPWSS